MSGDNKECPFCGERIPVHARECRYCEELVEPLPPDAVFEDQVNVDELPPGTADDFLLAYLRGAELRGAHLGGVDLFDAKLVSADLRRADLGQANLSNADLRGADLSGANLTGTDLSDADLSGADLCDANLRGADLSGAHLLNTVYDERTTWPTDFDPRLAGAIRR